MNRSGGDGEGGEGDNHARSQSLSADHAKHKSGKHKVANTKVLMVVINSSRQNTTDPVKKHVGSFEKDTLCSSHEQEWGSERVAVVVSVCGAVRLLSNSMNTLGSRTHCSTHPAAA